MARARGRALVQLGESFHSIGSLAIRFPQRTHNFASPPYDGFALCGNEIGFS
jgi:hypothetical protein